MGRKRLAVVILAAAALAAAGCTHHPATLPRSGIPASVERAPVTSPPPPPVSDLPPCGDIATTATPPDCYLQSRDPAALTVEVHHTGTGQQSSVVLTVLDPTGEQLQTLTEPSVGTTEPRLRDLDNDGRDELIIPIMLATSNTRYLIYRATGDSTHFTRAGELAGIGIDTTTANYVVVTARDSYELWKVQFWTFTGDQLTPLVTAEVHFLDDGSGHIGGSQCTVTDNGGLSRTGLTLAQATTQFCAEPTVLRVMR